MPTVKSLEDLKKIREEALKKRDIKSAPGSVQIVVGMARRASPPERAKPSKKSWESSKRKTWQTSPSARPAISAWTRGSRLYR